MLPNKIVKKIKTNGLHFIRETIWDIFFFFLNRIGIFLAFFVFAISLKGINVEAKEILDSFQKSNNEFVQLPNWEIFPQDSRNKLSDEANFFPSFSEENSISKSLKVSGNTLLMKILIPLSKEFIQ